MGNKITVTVESVGKAEISYVDIQEAMGRTFPYMPVLVAPAEQAKPSDAVPVCRCGNLREDGRFLLCAKCTNEMYREYFQPPAPQGVDDPFTGSFFAVICPFCGAGTTLEPDTRQIRPHTTPVIGAKCSASGMGFSEAEEAAKNLPTMDGME